MTYVEKNCKACWLPISVRLADHKRGWGNFCDKRCSAAYKCGQRPRDVNKTHAKYSKWARVQLEVLEDLYGGEMPPTAPSIKEQIGKNVRVKHKLHSPEKPVPDEIQEIRDHEYATDAMESGWDGHKSS